MIQFKELVFIRSKVLGKQLKIEDIRNLVKKTMDWSFTSNRYDVYQVYMNYENKAIYNNGIVIRKLYNGQYQVELVTSIPRQYCNITANTPFFQNKNHINYTFERSIFYSNPIPFFQSLGYKVQDTFQFKEVDYYKSLTFGVEIVIYPKNGYIQIVQTFASCPENDWTQSAANQVVNLLKTVLDGANEVVLSSGNMKPQDFLQDYN